MADSLRLGWRQFRLERRLFWRNPSAAFFNFLLPLLFLGLFGAIFHDQQADLDVIVPGIAGMAVMSTTFSALAYKITFLREEGVLKRVRGTPLPGGSYLGGHHGVGGREHRDPDRHHRRLRQGVLRRRLAAGRYRARRLRDPRRRLLRRAGSGLGARHPQLRLGRRLRQRRLPADAVHLRRLLRRGQRAALPARDRGGAAAEAPDRRPVGRDGHRARAGRQPQRPRGARRVGRGRV